MGLTLEPKACKQLAETVNLTPVKVLTCKHCPSKPTPIGLNHRVWGFTQSLIVRCNVCLLKCYLFIQLLIEM